ncbi:MAG: amino acid ABC transporter permease [Burkholderiales bacterium]|nr:MAG: amino acid ABC transporter permease [Burkholderiales bacterium]TAG84782.1 MAG: amino acid ABC transporter permease [Betaproteobacteria bacterium]
MVAETIIFQSKPARPAPNRTEGLLPWIKLNLFGTWQSALSTVIIGALLVLYVPQFLNWAIFTSTTSTNADACRAAGVGACWGAVVEKYRLIIFGRYPFDEQWRPLVATLIMLTMLVVSCIRYFWSKWLVLGWTVTLAAYFILMYGSLFGYLDVFGLSKVTTDRWGGLPLTIMLSTLSIMLAFPLAVVVALGRRSHLPAIRSLCTVYVELIRGVPLISVLFMASFMFPLFMPQGVTIDTLLRVLVGITLFAAAYMAEVVRGGLQSLPKGQTEAAASIGLSYWQTQRKIILPQALATVIPGIMNNFISIFKDTSLVTIVSLYELTGSHGLAFNSDADWRPFKLEGYLFIVAIYFVFCFAMSRYSLWIEAQVNKSKLR